VKKAEKNKDAEREESGGEETSSQKAAKNRSGNMQAAVESAWGKEQPEKLRDVTFGQDAKGHGYRTIVGPVLRDVAKSIGVDANTRDFPKVREALIEWEPDNSHWERVKRLLVCCCDECSDAMGSAGAETLDDDFLLKAPDLAQQRAKSARV
jgi:hypothetical protein